MDGTDGEHPTLSFVVRIWVEEPGSPTRRTFWRGHVTHVQSGERRAVDSIADVAAFIAGRLDAVKPRWWTGERLRRLRRRHR